MMNFDLYNPYSNTEVTSFYLGVITECIEKKGGNICHISKINRLHNNKAIIVIAAKDAIKAKIAGYQTVILWVQGIIPEESFLRHNSKARSMILSVIEKKGLKNADFIIYVSEAMRKHFNRKYDFNSNNYYIMPCFNDEINQEIIRKKTYDENIFVYAGGTDAWQCFEETISYYSKIEKIVPNAKLKLMVRNQEFAQKIINKYGVKNFSMVYVRPEEVAKELKECKFGFCLRKNNPVNNVATPTKLSSYVSNGVMPIYTEGIVDFCEKSKLSKYCFMIDNMDKVDEKLLQACNCKIFSDEVLEDYLNIFGNYYSTQYHIEKLSEILLV